MSNLKIAKLDKTALQDKIPYKKENASTMHCEAGKDCVARQDPLQEKMH